MKDSPRIVFWGTPGIAARFARHLVEDAKEKFRVTACVTQAEKIVQRQGRAVVRSPVHELALEKQIPVFTPRSLKKESESLLSELQKIGFDIFVVLAYGKILPQNIIDAPRYHSVNFHASLLPLLRGASPIEHSLLHGFTETGWTLQRIVQELDAGDILSQTRIAIDAAETTGTLYEKLTADLLTHGVRMIESAIEGKEVPRAQDESKATFCGKISTQDGRIDFTKCATDVRNRYRAFTPRPGVFTYFKEKKIKLDFDLNKLPLPAPDKMNPGEILREGKDTVYVVCGDTQMLKISALTPEGKRALTPLEFLNGYRVETGDEFV